MSDTFDSNPPTPLPIPGWYRDPTGHGDARYWNGVAWTDAVSRGSVTFQSPMPPDEVSVPPIPGSEYRSPTPTAAAPPPVAPPSPPPRRSSGPSILVGIAVAGVLVLLGVFLFSIVFDGEDDPPPTTESPTETTTPAPPPSDAPPESAP